MDLTRLANRAPLDVSRLDQASLMGCLDHSILRPELTRADVEAGIETAIRWQTATICCRPGDLELVVAGLRETDIGPTTVIGFPHGAHVTEIKKREAQLAVEQGAVELDVVLNIGALRGGETGRVRDELAEICAAVAPTTVKVILETAYLTPAQVETACRLSVEAGAAFVKNGTGYSPRGAEPDEIALMRRTVGNGVGVKAAGGARTLDQVLALIAAGANRVGASATDAIGRDWQARGPEAVRALLDPHAVRAAAPTGSGE